MGKLICVEGNDGAGKSTQIELITKYLKSKNLSFSFFHFPAYGHNIFSDLISKFLRGDLGDISNVDPYFLANIYAMNRFSFKQVLKEKLEENDILLLDRYVFSNIAFQGAKYENSSIENKKIKDWIFEFEFNFLKLPYPDLCLYFHLPIYIIQQRLSNRNNDNRSYLKGKKDIHEQDIDFQQKVQDNYLNLNGVKNYKIINCYDKIDYKVFNPDELFETYKNHITNIL